MLRASLDRLLLQTGAVNYLSRSIHRVANNLASRSNSNSDKSRDDASSRSSHESNRQQENPNEQRQLMVSGSFEHVSEKNRKTYLEMVQLFESQSVHRRNHVEFIYAALRNMESFGVHRDIEVYRALMNVLPKGKFIPTNIIQSEFMHYPKQQQVIIDLLEQMEDNAVIPDHEMQDILLNTFGKRGHPVLKYWRMMYWMPKFKNLSPWLLPDPLPNEALQLARLAVERMCTVDLGSVVKTYDTIDVEESIDKTWIVSGMSADQRQLLRNHTPQVALNIEGPFTIWMRNKKVIYFTLRGDPPIEATESKEDADDMDDVSSLRFNPFNMRPKTKALARRQTVHEQDDGTIYAICATGSSTKDSLLSWIRLLERDDNEILSRIPILFKFKSPVDSQLVPLQRTTEQ